MADRFVCPSCHSHDIEWHKALPHTYMCVCKRCGAQFTLTIPPPEAPEV